MALLNLMQNKIVPLTETQKTILVVGRFPGLTLATPARIRTLYAYAISPPISQKTLILTQKFYAQIENRPKIVLIYEDKYLSAINPLEPNFLTWYEKIESYKTPLIDTEGSSGNLTVFRLR
jgi:hypothetical protein